MANSIYSETYEKCKEEGIPTTEEIEIFLKRHKIFTVQMEEEAKALEKSDYFKYHKHKDLSGGKTVDRYVERCVREIITGARLFSAADLKKDKDSLDDKDDADLIRYRELRSIKQGYTRFTCEGFAEDAKSKYLTYLCCLNAETGERIFSNYNNLTDDDRILSIMMLSAKAMEFFGGLPISTMRHIARHHLWRTKWISATKTGQQVFSGLISEWDVNKTYLCYWSNFYDNIYAAHEPPEEHVIKNDAFLDSWLEQKKRERDAKSNGTATGSEDGNRYFFNNMKVNPARRK